MAKRDASERERGGGARDPAPLLRQGLYQTSVRYGQAGFPRSVRRLLPAPALFRSGWVFFLRTVDVRCYLDHAQLLEHIGRIGGEVAVPGLGGVRPRHLESELLRFALKPLSVT